MIEFILVDPLKKYPDTENPVFMHGPVEAYWGSGTTEKKTAPLIKIVSTDRALDAAKRLLRVRMWVIDEQSSLRPFLDNLIESHTELSNDILELISGVYFGGSVTHRFSDVMSKHVCRPTIRGKILTCVYISDLGMNEFK